MRTILLALLTTAACRPDSGTDTPLHAPGDGELCFVDAAGTTLRDAEVSLRVMHGVLDSGEARTDARGCVSLAGIAQGYYQPDVDGHSTGFANVYLREGDVVQLRLASPRATIEYTDPTSPSAMLTRFVARYQEGPTARKAAIEEALRAPVGSEMHQVGLLASFQFDSFLGTGEPLQWPNRSEQDALALFESIPPNSPLLTAFPSAPIAAQLTLGGGIYDDPHLSAIIERHPERGVGAYVLLTLMAIAEREKDLGRARALFTRIMDDQYVGTFAHGFAMTVYQHLGPGLHAGDPAPELTALADDGTRHELSSRDRPIVLYFYASYCAPCKDGPAHLRAVADRWGDRVRIVAISIDEDSAPARDFRANYGPFPGLIIDGADNPDLVSQLGIHAVPLTMVLADGQTVLRMGEGEWASVEDALSKLLENSSSG